MEFLIRPKSFENNLWCPRINCLTIFPAISRRQKLVRHLSQTERQFWYFDPKSYFKLNKSLDKSLATVASLFLIQVYELEIQR